VVSEHALHRAVERFGQTLEAAGMPRMPARVFAYVIAEDRHTYTARDLAEGLGVSAGAISGAVRYLVEARLLLKERAPGSRGDLFRVIEGDVWGAILRSRLPLLDHMVAGVEEAIEILGNDSPGVRRLHETREFLEFNRAHTQQLIADWAQIRAQASPLE
jgi:DNA-binding transcriptional regulator GbsR (MarR family)